MMPSLLVGLIIQDQKVEIEVDLDQLDDAALWHLHKDTIAAEAQIKKWRKKGYINPLDEELRKKELAAQKEEAKLVLIK